jgi:hypothetical protein
MNEQKLSIPLPLSPVMHWFTMKLALNWVSASAMRIRQ